MAVQSHDCHMHIHVITPLPNKHTHTQHMTEALTETQPDTLLKSYNYYWFVLNSFSLSKENCTWL